MHQSATPTYILQCGEPRGEDFSAGKLVSFDFDYDPTLWNKVRYSNKRQIFTTANVGGSK
jgi:hypothetical protein